MIAITVSPAEKATAKVTVGPFTDESGDEVTPQTVTWTLTNKNGGTTVNERVDESVTPAATVSFLLTGNDLALTHNPQRVLTITWTYNSTLGNGLIGRAQAEFSIENMNGVS